MTAKGFERIGAGAYHHPAENLAVWDMHPRNVKISDTTGQVRVIDPIIERLTPDEAQEIKSSSFNP
jgi:hypothetical protein